jgi:hypothetical protein
MNASRSEVIYRLFISENDGACFRVIHFAMLPVCSVGWQEDGGVMDWKASGHDTIEVLSQCLPKETEENTKPLSQNSRCHDRNSNQIPHERLGICQCAPYDHNLYGSIIVEVAPSTQHNKISSR